MIDLDINTLRIAVTLAGLALFALLVRHSYSGRRRGEHDAAARLPFLDTAEAGAADADGASPPAAGAPAGRKEAAT